MTEGQLGQNITKLSQCLRLLSQDEGVWRPSLLQLLAGELSDLKSLWAIDSERGLEAARLSVAASLHALIAQLTPRRSNQPLTPERRNRQYKMVALAYFNVLPGVPVLHEMNLTQRREWLADKERGPLRVSVRTSQRDFEHAIVEIERMLTAGHRSQLEQGHSAQPKPLATDVSAEAGNKLAATTGSEEAPFSGYSMADSSATKSRTRRLARIGDLLADTITMFRGWWLFTVTIALAVTAPLSSRILPPYSSGLVSAIDDRLRDPFFMMACVGVGIAIGALVDLTAAAKRWLANGIITLLALSVVLYSIGHWYGYHRDTELASDLRQEARNANSVYVEEFDDNGQCDQPELWIGEAVLPFTECAIAQGVLKARLTSAQEGIGIYPARSSTFWPVSGYGDDVSARRYYLETRFRTPSPGSIWSCGMSLETDDGIFVFRVRQDSTEPAVSYVSEVVRVPIPPIPYVWPPSERPTVQQVLSDYWRYYEVESLSTGHTQLPFVGRGTLPGLDYANWTKLALYVDGLKHVLLINDRVAMSFEHPTPDMGDAIQPGSGVSQIDRASVAVMSGSTHSGGDATCEFDYFRAFALRS